MSGKQTPGFKTAGTFPERASGLAPRAGHAAHAPRIRVLIADDHPAFCEGLKAMIYREPDLAVLPTARNGREAVALWHQHQPDVGLFDIRMPELDGIAALHEIRGRNPGARIILLSAFGNDECIYRGLHAGARAFLLKDVGRAELLDCLRQVHAGEICVPPLVAAKLAHRVGEEELTSREMEVLRWLANGKSNKEIAALLFISETTVKTHLKNVFGKLRVLSRTEAVAEANRRGIVEL